MAGGVSAVGGVTSAHHHGSHRHLLSDKTVALPRDVDAIVVPTARHAAGMRDALALANKLDCTLVALCSKYSSVHELSALREARNAKLIAIDIERLPSGIVPFFRTDGLLTGTRFERWTDTSLKRNLGLLLAKLIGWERIVFLDDDITIPEPLDLCAAAGLTDIFAGVGLNIDGFPDNSVVCHAYRDAGGAQDMFIGGGALAVPVRQATSFFPNIYNEDWFFLLGDDGRLRPTAVTGRAVQKEYDPFAHDNRARLEEFGDSIAEGVFWLLDSGRSIADATTGHWRTFLDNRAAFITEVVDLVWKMDGDAAHRARMLSSVKAARGRCQYIRPELCVEYLDAWRADRLTWRNHLSSVFREQIARKGTKRKDRRSRAAVHDLFRSLGLPESCFRLSLPRERLDEDPADLDPEFPYAVGQ
jgi:hypothetical protein